MVVFPSKNAESVAPAEAAQVEIKAVKRQAQELAQLSKQHQLILDTALDGLVGIDKDGATTFVNPAAANMMGRRLADIAGQEIHSLVHPIFPGVITCDVTDCELYAALRDEDAHQSVEDMFFRADGRSFPVEFSIARTTDDDGTLRGWRNANSPGEMVRDDYLAVKQDTRMLDTLITRLFARDTLLAIAARRGIVADEFDWFLPHYSSEYFRSVLMDGLAALDFGIDLPWRLGT